MKKIFLILGLVTVFTELKAQNIQDLLRYSQTEPVGTARFRGLSGAFGAVGGDLSAISLNPASSSIFNNNQFGVSLNNNYVSNRTNYFGTSSRENTNDFELNQLGAVFVFKSDNKKAKVNKFALSVNYEKQNNFNDATLVNGVNPNNSIANYFLNHANKNGGISAFDIDRFYYSHVLNDQNVYVENYGFLANYFNTSQSNIQNNLGSYIYQYLGETGGTSSYSDQQAFLGFESYIIDVADDYNNSTNRKYKSLVAEGGNYNQEHSIVSTGYNGKLTFNGSVSIKDKVVLGLNLNSHFSDYTRLSRFVERNSNPMIANDRVKRIYFDNDIRTLGNGFSFQIGSIVKLSKFFRLGATYESPTWHKLADEVTQRLTAISGNNVRELTPDVVNPNLTLVFDPYKIRTADKLTLSGAVILGKRGFISVDYGQKFYDRMQLRPENEFKGDNDYVAKYFKTAKQLAVGGEFKIERWSLRGGFRLEESPYKNTEIMGDLRGNSFGVGYNFGGTKVDLAYSGYTRGMKEQIFTSGLVDNYARNTRNTNITATVSFEF